MSKTTLDLSTLDLTDGTHTVKVKAKADGYRDSEFSNEVNYTKAPTLYSGQIGGTVFKNTVNIYGKDAQGVSHLVGESVGHYKDVSGYVSYNVYPSKSMSDSTVTESVRCTYSTESTYFKVIPTGNGFSFGVS